MKVKRRSKKKRGFTDKLAVALVAMIFLGLVGGFYLANKSINADYSGSLMCWTIVFTPIGTALSLVLNSVVKKNQAENTSADGEGIAYAATMAELTTDSPDI
jgi:hypothetical protein